MPWLTLPSALRLRLWEHARREAPRECVGLLGGQGRVVTSLYPLTNVAPHPERAYRAHDLELLRALRAMRAESLELVGIYHSHPRGPPHPSDEDRRLAAWDVPYLIADLHGRTLRAYLMPSGQEVRVDSQD